MSRDQRIKKKGIRPVNVKQLPAHRHRIENAIALAVVVVPVLGIVVAAALAWQYRLRTTDIVLCTVFYFLTGFGITVGFHRFFTHNSFEAHSAVRATLAILGSMAIQGPVIRWVADHRRHHAFSDDEGDPHSPHHEEHDGIKDYLKGMWYAHIGWFFSKDKTIVRRFAPDLLNDPVITTVDRFYLVWVLLSLVLPAALGGVLTGSASGMIGGFLWGSLVRIFLVHHAIWSVNSLCHLFGRRAFSTRDESRNNWVMALFAFGEGWHNNHHAVAWSACHGMRKREFDLSYLCIATLKRLGLVRNVKTFTLDGDANTSPAVQEQDVNHRPCVNDTKTSA